MAIHLIQKIYDKCPVPLKSVFLNAYSIKIHNERYGRGFKYLLDELSKTQFFTNTQIDSYQNERFIKIVDHAFKTVPFYVGLAKSGVVNPGQIKTKEDIVKLPILNKDIVRAEGENLISKNFSKRDLIHGHTSGTTGSPLDIYWDKNTCIFNNAMDLRQKLWAGVSYGEKIALLLGRPIVGTKKTIPPFWVTDLLHKQIWMSSFHLNDKFLPYYAEKLVDFKPVAIEGYPSTVYLLAKYLVDNDLRLPMKAVFTSSETFYDYQKEIIESAFGCNVTDFYGMAERVIFATECGKDCGKHLNFEYGLTEVVDENDNPVEDGEYGYLVSTTLQNMGMPLIRYKTTDVSRILKKRCKCGRQMRLIENLTTKSEDLIKRPDGTFISPSILTHPFKPIKSIDKSQIIQYDHDKIKIKIVKRPGFSDADSNMLLGEFKKRVKGMDVHIEFVPDIPRESSGKYRWVVCQISKKRKRTRDDFSFHH